MPSSSLIAMGVAGVAIAGFLTAVAGASLTVGALEFLFGKAKLKILKSTKGANGFAFAYEWDNGKEPARFDRVKVRMFNPFGSPTQIDASKDFEPKDSSFALDIELHSFEKILESKGFENSLIQVELFSSKDGISSQFEFKGPKFKDMLLNAPKTADQYNEKFQKKVNPNLAKFGVAPAKSMIADTVPGKGPQLKIATNPAFAADFQAAATGAAPAAGGAPAADFAITKVWIEPGCIVCNACENIFPEVFEVKADTCIIRPGAPLDQGLKVKEAAEACPVEVIKFTKAG